jgi:hypothetical protein
MGPKFTEEAEESEHNVDLQGIRQTRLTDLSFNGSKMQKASYLSQPRSVKGRTIDATA